MRGKKDMLTFISSNMIMSILGMNVFITEMLKGGCEIHSLSLESISGIDGLLNLLAHRLQSLKGSLRFHL